jgi:hypothetical protein
MSLFGQCGVFFCAVDRELKTGEAAFSRHASCSERRRAELLLQSLLLFPTIASYGPKNLCIVVDGDSPTSSTRIDEIKHLYIVSILFLPSPPRADGSKEELFLRQDIDGTIRPGLANFPGLG